VAVTTEESTEASVSS